MAHAVVGLQWVGELLLLQPPCPTQDFPEKCICDETYLCCMLDCMQNNHKSIVGPKIKQIMEQGYRPPPTLPLSRASVDQLVKTVYCSFCSAVVENYVWLFVTSFIVYFGIVMLCGQQNYIFTLFWDVGD